MCCRWGQGVTGHRDGGAGDGSRVSGPAARGVAAGIGSLGPHRVGRRPDPDGGPVLRADLRQGESAEWCDVLRWSQRVIDLADGDPSKGNFIFGSPLAVASRGRAWPVIARAVPVARRPAARPGHGPQRRPRVLRHGRHLGLHPRDTGWRAGPDDSAVGEIEDALRDCRTIGDDLAVALARMTLGVALLTAQRLPSVTADKSCWPRSAKRSCAGTQPVRVTDHQRVLGT